MAALTPTPPLSVAPARPSAPMLATARAVTESPEIMVAGRYRLDRKIGSGGMATVWSATDLKIGRVVAVKLMSKTLASDVGLRRRFLDEARSLAKIASPHVVSVHDYDFSGPAPFLAMERLDGQDLGQLSRANGNLGIDAIFDISRQAAAGLFAAHRVGVIHRDVKLGNIFVCDTATEVPLVKLLDFGVAKTVGDNSAVTAADTFVGSVAYSSPEHILGLAPTPSFDLWGLAVVAYRLLVGVVPFRGPVVEVLRNIVTGPFPLPSAASPDLPVGCDPFFARALAKDPDARFQTVEAFVDALERALAPALGAPSSRRRREQAADEGALSASVAEEAAPMHDTFVDAPSSHHSQTMHIDSVWTRIHAVTASPVLGDGSSTKEPMS